MKYLFIIFFLFHLSTFSQGTIKGHVHDRRQNEDLPFVGVKILELNLLQTADLDGNFTFRSVPSGKYHLKAQYIGYCDTTTEVAITGNDSINIYLELPPPCKYDKKNKTCPKCHKRDKAIPIVYGLIVSTKDSKDDGMYETYYPGGCNVTCCDPNWYCKRDKFEY